jgi:YVTN family beta-propeller protein
VYPRLDSAVLEVPETPPIARVLGFDADGGALAFVDDKGLPRRLDLRASEVRFASREKLSGIASVNGSDLYAVGPGGSVLRITPSGDWTFKPPFPARRIFPQADGSLVIAGDHGGRTELWLIRPTDDDILGKASLPPVSQHPWAQAGDRLYFAVDSGLIGVRTRDLTLLKSVRLDKPVNAVVATPSGDRLYVALMGSDKLAVVDRYTETVSETVDLPGPASDLRMDPLGQNLLARPAGESDSVWVIGVGTDRVAGTITSKWRADLPAFAPGRTIATTRGADVVFLSPSTLADERTVPGGAKDFWSFVAWNGFRPRAEGLDVPVTFDSADSSPPADSPSVADSAPGFSPPLRDATPTMIQPPAGLAPRPAGYMVSFAAVLSEQKAAELASGIAVNGVRPQVLATRTGSTTIYRVVLGPYASREEAERVGRDSNRQYWVYEERQ